MEQLGIRMVYCRSFLELQALRFLLLFVGSGRVRGVGGGVRALVLLS